MLFSEEHKDIYIFAMVFYVLVMGGVSNAETWVIRSYLKSKPLGMQTVFDKFCCDLTMVFQVIVSFTMLIFSTGWLLGPFSQMEVKIALITSHQLQIFTHCSILATVIVRYLEVYHISLLTEFEESKLLKVARTTIFVLGFLMNIYDIAWEVSGDLLEQFLLQDFTGYTLLFLKFFYQ